MEPHSDLWTMADRSGRLEFRCDCPYCSKRRGDKTLSLNTRKRVGICHRCGWKLAGKPQEHFSSQHVVDLTKERSKREWRFNQIKETTLPFQRGDLVGRYLEKRLGAVPEQKPRLGITQSLRHYESDGQYTCTPAMVGALQDVSGRVVGWHTTALSTDGEKAFGGGSRRYCKRYELKGSAVRLYPPGKTLLVAEGIETALAWASVIKEPVWACTSASLLKTFEPPECVETLIIAADNDVNRVGQTAAQELRQRLMRDMYCVLMIPPKKDTDWLDELRGGA